MEAFCQAVIAELVEFHSSVSSWVAKSRALPFWVQWVRTSTSFQVDAVFEVLVAILFLAILYCAVLEFQLIEIGWKLCGAVMSHSLRHPSCVAYSQGRRSY